MKFSVAMPEQLFKAYGPYRRLSTSRLSPAKWRLCLAAFVAVSFALLMLTLYSLSGSADPTRGWAVTRPDQMPIARTADPAGDERVALRPLPALPYMIEAQRDADSAQPSTWGFWLNHAGQEVQQFLIDERGYISVDAGAGWQPFIHVDSASNTLTLRIDAGGRLTWRINGEIAWAGQIAATGKMRVGLITRSPMNVDTVQTRIYSPGP